MLRRERAVGYSRGNFARSAADGGGEIHVGQLVCSVYLEDFYGRIDESRGRVM